MDFELPEELAEVQQAARHFAEKEIARSAAQDDREHVFRYGYFTEFPVERYYRDTKSCQIVEGSVNIQKLISAVDVLGYKRANR